MNLLNIDLKYLLVSFIFLLLTLQTNAQYDWERDLSVKVFENGEELANPWTGGFTAPQFSRIDVDMDGDKDLFVFDRDGYRKLVFINEDPTPGAMNYRYAPEYADAFPELRDWALLRDYDCDGKEDIFTSFQSSVKVYRNTSTEEGGLSFELASNQLASEFDFGAGPEFFPLLVLSIDLPSITDYDGDGDLDIVTFTESATTMYFFEGQGADNGDCSDLSFVCTNRCYGMARESAEDNNMFIGDEFECPFNVLDPRQSEDREFRHTGGTLVSIDLDQNGIKDLVIGDVSFKTQTGLYMEDAIDGQDSTILADPAFPDLLDNEMVEIQKFPAGFYEDINNDGVRDYIVAPNTRIEVDGHQDIWFYINNGQDDAPDLELTSTNFMMEETIELGIGAYPVLFDYNNDGLQDLVVANKEYYVEIDLLPSQLALYENTGTQEEPQFTLIDDNFEDIPSYQIESVYPSFGDLDGDGDADMILGEESGILHFFENIAEEGASADFELATPAIQDNMSTTIDVGQFATPQLFDVDEDGLLDLLIGEKGGIVNYYKNVGSESEYLFEQQLGAAEDSLGGFAVNSVFGINGYSVPFMFKDSEGDLNLFVSNEIGTIQHFTNIEGNLDGYFTEEDNVLDGIQEGDRAGVCVGDVNGDDLKELVYGISNGGLIYFSASNPDFVEDETQEVASRLIVFPNPAQDALNIQIGPDFMGGEIQVFAVDGRQVHQQTTSTSGIVTLNTSEWASGYYLVNLVHEASIRTAGVVVR